MLATRVKADDRYGGARPFKALNYQQQNVVAEVHHEQLWPWFYNVVHHLTASQRHHTVWHVLDMKTTDATATSFTSLTCRRLCFPANVGPPFTSFFKWNVTTVLLTNTRQASLTYYTTYVTDNPETLAVIPVHMTTHIRCLNDHSPMPTRHKITFSRTQ